MTGQNATASVPRFGPVDRESFLDAQLRSRRATWRISAFCVLAAFALGIPLTLALTPLLYAVVLSGAELYNLFSPLPPEFWIQARELAQLAMRVGDAVFNHRPIDSQSLLLGSTIVLLPGITLSLFLWAGIFILFRRSGVGGALLALNAREPNRGKLEELQLVDVIQEMAIAAGIPSPRLMLIDEGGANAAIIGTGVDDARIVISRRLIEVLTREELEGVLAHLVGSASNGDLRIAFNITSIFEAYGLVLTLINSPFGRRSRSTLGHILGFAFRRSAEERAREAETVAKVLTGNMLMETDDIDDFFQPSSGRTSFLRKCLNFVFFPILFTNLAIRLILWFFSATMLQPGVAFLWRTREYLADASAVQLTRNPQYLASALQKLNDEDSSVPGVAWASHLFIVSPGRGDRMQDERAEQNRAHQMATAWQQSAARPQSSAAAEGLQMAGLGPEILLARSAALRGDPQAIARLMAFGQAIAAAQGKKFSVPPVNPDDLAAAQKGDREAIARLEKLMEDAESQLGGHSGPSSAPEGLESIGAAFHPSLKRRLKRLERMGAQVSLEEGDKGAWKVYTFFGALFAPFAVLLVAGFLLLIAVMTMASLTFLLLWLTAIHGIFSLLGHG